ncbi:glycoside hydrolase family 15 protein [Streptomyces sp. NPDC006516]|uniref:glycoside hydrolase family 15 protein n=1 Tax=Streptomyces sp. NPDC006516 TaxID=3154309 RepID=UPI0033ADD4DA
MNENIEDYALIGDLETAAMIGRDGSIDWLCLPRFDSPACFAALLGTGENGFWRVSPAGAGLGTHRAYRAGTLVLDTFWDTPSGTVRVTDFMPPRVVRPCIVRMVEGLSGSVRMRSELKPRFHQGRVVPWVRATERFTVATAGPDSTWLGTEGPVQMSGGPDSTVGDFTVSAGEQVTLQLVWAPSHLPDVPSALRIPAATMLRETQGFWRCWVSRCQYQGPSREAVVRSLITLKALIYAPTGSVVAAPTTSLPEQLGGERNWDYRHCWLRDSTLALSCLLRSGYQEEATAWLDWLLRATAGGLSGLQSVYGLGGERLLPETEAPWLPGYEGSRPVRFGNAAVEQYQLDVYGEVLDTLYWALRAGVTMKPRMWSLVKELMGYLLIHWRDPDQGLWEVRGPRRHFVHSKVMSWVAADRALRMGEMLGRNGTSKEWRAMKDTVHREVCREGWDDSRGSFVQTYGGTALDASALLIPGLGFLPASDGRVRGTVRAMRALDQDGFLYRYRLTGPGVDRVDGMPGSECPFVACSLWYADALAATGDLDEAQNVFDRVLAVRNDVGLLSEQWDPAGRRQLGNAPQAFSHISLVETAFAMQRMSLGHGDRGGDERSSLRTAVSSSMPESP